MPKLGYFLLLLVPVSCANASDQDTTLKNAMQHSEQPAGEGGVANLPFSRGRTFATLDAYLAYLEQYNGPLDMPWWREISPGVYRQQLYIANLDVEPETATRAELEKRFGFTPSR
ncbi:hypothetical protein [Aurantiacibacter poecillastricola]|uniref:hypothetical protein n=1 Tax=Aurantiacibacter poecillastricola TaxID=3064385 RepID=UPI00273F4CC9|nr:hypothetical protein [Aurantiacibacter sp. 219JJ12-13]MDP5261324.1 hypothetical protein [Aurantiacibacter sp. 219JJ12-13]